MTRKEIEEKTGATYMENAQIESVRTSDTGFLVQFPGVLQEAVTNV